MFSCLNVYVKDSMEPSWILATSLETRSCKFCLKFTMQIYVIAPALYLAIQMTQTKSTSQLSPHDVTHR